MDVFQELILFCGQNRVTTIFKHGFYQPVALQWAPMSLHAFSVWEQSHPGNLFLINYKSDRSLWIHAEQTQLLYFPSRI